MARPQIATILKNAASLSKDEDKIKYLKDNDDQAIRWILMCMYDRARVNFNVPNKTMPDYIPNRSRNTINALYSQIRKLPYFVEGELGGNLTQIKRELMFVGLLESVHVDDAEVLLKMLQQEPYEGLSKSVINAAYGELISDQRKANGKK